MDVYYGIIKIYSHILGGYYEIYIMLPNKGWEVFDASQDQKRGGCK